MLFIKEDSEEEKLYNNIMIELNELQMSLYEKNTDEE